MPRRGVCGRCGAVRRKGRAASSAPFTACLDCNVPLCVKHALWVADRNGYVCRKCQPEANRTTGRILAPEGGDAHDSPSWPVDAVRDP